MDIPISRPSISNKEMKEVVAVLKSKKIVQGPKVQELEHQFTKSTGARYAVAVSNGTAALHTALVCAGIQPGDEVITTPFTFIASVNAILMAGAVPVFVDIAADTYTINPLLIEKAITKKTKALLPVNLYGQPVDYDKLQKIAKKHGLIIIEDAAQSVGATYKNRNSGTLGDVACFSLYATKNIMCGEGGVITTNSQEIYDRAKRFRHHGQDEKKRYEYFGLGYNYRLTDVLAAMAVEQMKRLDTITQKRQSIARYYSTHLCNISWLQTPQTLPDISHAYHQYTVRITDTPYISRNVLQKKLLDAGIQTTVYYPKPLYAVDHLKHYVKKNQVFPVTEAVSKTVVSLPIYPSLTKKELQYIVSTIRSL